MTGNAGPSVEAAVIGCGAIAQHHLAYLSTSPVAALHAVCDTSRAAGEFACRRFGAERSFTDVDAMLTDVRPTVVHVLTPPDTHQSLSLRCLDAGAHVVCEKPLTASAADTAAVLARAAAVRRMIIESRNLLWNDSVRRIDELIVTGRLGEVREVDLLLSLDLTAGPFGDLNLEGPGVRLPGGAVHDFLPHLAYLFLHFAGEPDDVDECIGTLRNASGNARVGYDQLDSLVVIGKRRGHLRIASDLQPDAFRLSVRGTRGSVETDLYYPFLRVEGGANVGKRAPIEQLVSGLRLSGAGLRNARDKVIQHGTYHGLSRMLDAFYRSVRDGSAPIATARQIAATACLVDRLVGLRQAQP